MSQERLSMRKLQEVLRLKGDRGLCHPAFAGSCGTSLSTLSDYVQRSHIVILAVVLLRIDTAGVLHYLP